MRPDRGPCKCPAGTGIGYAHPVILLPASLRQGVFEGQQARQAAAEPSGGLPERSEAAAAPAYSVLAWVRLVGLQLPGWWMLRN